MKQILILIGVLIVFSSFVSAGLGSGNLEYHTYNVDARDSYGTRNGTVTGATHVDTGGIISGHYSFDGNDKISNPYVNLEDTNTSFSVQIWANYTSTSNMTLVSNYYASQAFYRLHVVSGKVGFYCRDTNNGDTINLLTTGTYNNAAWHHVVLTRSGSNFSLYVDGSLKKSSLAPAVDTCVYKSGSPATEVGVYASTSLYFTGRLDEVSLWNRALNSAEVSSLYSGGAGQSYPFINYGTPVFSNINCTSCNIPYGDTTEPYSTSDTTPTFKLNTSVSANCRISDESLSYTAMGDSRNCTSGQGTGSHTCTLTVQDELIFSPDYVYVTCINIYNTSATNTENLTISLTNLGDTTLNAIDQGIQASAIWPEATVYSNQKVYLRDINNNQVLATVDRVVVYGNQRWLLNYALQNESKQGLFNITPAVYSLDMTNISSSQIKSAVEALINSTVNN